MPRPKKQPDPAEAVADRLLSDTPRTEPIPCKNWLSSGVTLLNLAASAHPDHFIAKGQYVYFVGDSSSGKTFLAFNIFAEAARNPNFKKHRLIFDNAENGALMDVGRYFGQSVADRVEAPGDNNSRTIQEFFYHLDNALAKPTIYVLDSVDAINADEDEAKFEEELTAWEKDKDVKGSYGMAKPKYISRNINRVVQKLRDTDSILVLISQTRDKVGGHIPGQKTRSGGRALKFFAHLELWSSVRSPITKSALGKEREIGATIQIDIQKNRLSGWEGKVQIPFIRTHGWDEMGSLVDFLADEHWQCQTVKGKGLVIQAPEFEFEGTRENFIHEIESTEQESKLKELAQSIWNKIEDACKLSRKKRYE